MNETTETTHLETEVAAPPHTEKMITSHETTTHATTEHV
jgi:hypothetical protein